MKLLTADFGSTYTKLVAIDTEKASIIGTACAFTTIDTDIIHGFRNALSRLETTIGSYNYDRLLCCSSAGGGLKMIALGLVPELTAKAARMAASSAGAKVIKTYAFEISKKEQDEIYSINPDLILLCGGTDGGNKEVIIANANRLCTIDRNFTVVAAGNKSASHELESIFAQSGKDYVITDNVMPVFNKLNIEPAKQSIREVFIQKIIAAKGLTGVQKMSFNDIIPTPLAVMNACELLSKGTSNSPGIGEFIAVDLGGATTDVYSMSEGTPSLENVLIKGLPEPFSKRTVEGDLGMRYSLSSLSEEINLNISEAETGLSQTQIHNWLEWCISHPDAIAKPNSEEESIEELLAGKAIEVAMERHCGFIERTYTPMGEIYVMTGKDLSQVNRVIGIGGAIVNSQHPQKLLEGVRYTPQKFQFLKPKNPQFFIDRKYIFASMGLLSSVNAELALQLMKKEIELIQ